MKVNIYETVEVSDADRKAIATVLGQKTATRDDLKSFIWKHGQDWRQALTPAVDDGARVVGVVAEPFASADQRILEDDLLGVADEDLDLI